MRRICSICARGASKGVPDKNLRPLLGKPLLAHSIVQALASDLFVAVAVSSDSPEILSVAEAYGATHCIQRPAELATDSVDKMPAIIHCVSEVENRTESTYDVMVDLDVTAPLRITEDIAGAVKLLETTDADNILTGCPSSRSPYYNMLESDERGYAKIVKPPEKPIHRRQDAPPTYDMNASIYVWRRASFFTQGDGIILDRTRIFAMPGERSIDVDSELDFQLIEFLTARPEFGRT